MEIIGKPRIMPYGFRFLAKNDGEERFKKALEWCYREFGDNEKWTHRNHFWFRTYKSGYGAIYFTDVDYGAAFKLRWI